MKSLEPYTRYLSSTSRRIEAHMHPCETNSLSLHLFAVSPTRIAEVVLKLLHQGVDLAPSRASVLLQDESIHHHTKDDTGEKPDHQPIGEHLIGHTLTSLPECSWVSANR